MSLESLSRRTLLVKGGEALLALPVATGVLASLTSLFSDGIRTAAAQEAPLQQYNIPTYKETIEPALRSRDMEIIPGGKLAGDGSFREFVIKRAGRIIGRFFTKEEGGNGYFDLMVCDGDHPEDFQARAHAYELGHRKAEVILQFAGAFSCNDGQCVSQSSRDWEPDGVLIQNGVSVGWPNLNSKYGGVVILRKGRDPAIYSRNNIPLDTTRSTTLQEIATTVPQELAQASIFQAYTLVEEGQPQRFRDPNIVSRRILTERHFYDAGNHLQYGWGVLQLDDPNMTLTEIGEFLREFGVRNAALLNTGSHALGWVKRKGGEEFLLTLHPDEPVMPNFTNVFVAAVSQK